MNRCRMFINSGSDEFITICAPNNSWYFCLAFAILPVSTGFCFDKLPGACALTFSREKARRMMIKNVHFIFRYLCKPFDDKQAAKKAYYFFKRCSVKG